MWSQSEHPQRNSGELLIGPIVHEAVFAFSAREKSGAPAQTSPSDIELRINGKPAMPISFRQLSRPDLRYCLIFDKSGSQRINWNEHVNEAAALLKLIQPGRDYGVLVAFNESPDVIAEGTDPGKFLRAISQQQPRQATALYDAVVACADDMAKNQSTAIRVMFVLSDGDDNFSHMGRDETLKTLVRTGIRVYAIGKRNESDPWQNNASKGIKTLRQFAETTGGKAFVVKNERDLNTTISDITGDLNNMFSVAISTTSLPGDNYYKVEVKANKKLAISAPQQLFVPLN